MPKGIYKRKTSHRKGKKRSKETIEKIRKATKLAMSNPEVRKKISIARSGKPSNSKGKKRTQESCKRISEAHKGLKHSKETKQKMSESHKDKKHPWNPSGKNHPRWIKDRSKLKRFNDSALDRRSSAYGNWRKQVLIRDNYTCKLLDKNCKGRLEVHHILGYTQYQELRYNINNGITLCRAHHPRGIAKEKRLISKFQELVSVSKD